MDGMETLRLIMRRAPMPVVLFSTHSKEGGYATLKALALGAIDFVQKPQDAAAGHLESVADQLIEKIKVAKRAAGRKLPAAVVSDDPPKGKKKNHSALPPNRIIAIGISTGGPNCPIEVQEARSGDLLVAGRVLICPGNRHIMVRRMPRGDMAVLSDGSPVNGHRPSADVLFHSVAQQFGPTAVGLLMTGMGEDGAEGLGALKAAGGVTIAQSEDTCVVSGMPRAAISKGYADKVIPLESIAAFLVQNYGGDRSSSEKFEKNENNDKHEKSERTPVSSHRT
jgi:two-component system chemotaxis response regulator CheB